MSIRRRSSRSLRSIPQEKICQSLWAVPQHLSREREARDAPQHNHLYQLFGGTDHAASPVSEELAWNRRQQSRLRPNVVLNVLLPHALNRSRTHHPYLLEGIIVLQRDHIVRKGDELKVVRRYCDVSKHALFFEDASDQRGRPGNQKKGVRVLLRLSSMSFDLVLRQMSGTTIVDGQMEA